MIFKSKSPIDKENTRFTGFFNECIKATVPINHYPNPHSPSQNYLKTKINKDQYSRQTNLPGFGKLTTNLMNLECDQILQEISENKQVKSETNIQNSLLCQEELESTESDKNLSKGDLLSRVGKILRAYQERTEYLQRQNVNLKEQLQRQRQNNYYHMK